MGRLDGLDFLGALSDLRARFGFAAQVGRAGKALRQVGHSLARTTAWNLEENKRMLNEVRQHKKHEVHLDWTIAGRQPGPSARGKAQLTFLPAMPRVEHRVAAAQTRIRRPIAVPQE
jgi:hypothetical protein